MREALRETVEQLEQHLKEPPVFSADLTLSKELRELQESLRKATEDIDNGKYDEVDNRLGNADGRSREKSRHAA